MFECSTFDVRKHFDLAVRQPCLRDFYRDVYKKAIGTSVKTTRVILTPTSLASARFDDIPAYTPHQLGAVAMNSRGIGERGRPKGAKTRRAGALRSARVRSPNPDCTEL